MQNIIQCVLLVVMTTSMMAVSADYGSMGFGLNPGYFGWGYGMGSPVLGTGYHYSHFGTGRTGFALPISPMSFGYTYHQPMSAFNTFRYNMFGMPTRHVGFGGLGYGAGFYPSYNAGAMRRRNTVSRRSRRVDNDDDDNDTVYWPLSNVDEWSYFPY